MCVLMKLTIKQGRQKTSNRCLQNIQKEWHNGRRNRKLAPGKEAHKCGAGRRLQNKLGVSGEGASLSEGDTARWRGGWNCRPPWESSAGQTSGPKVGAHNGVGAAE